jgi:hypothetical protein
VAAHRNLPRLGGLRRLGGLVLALGLFGLARRVAAQDGAAPAPISDNSFLIEEAFNQQSGVVQHISTLTRPDGGGAWAYAFTQEWPLLGVRHQISYTIPVLKADGSGTGVGDIGLNFRYQLIGADGGVVHVAPRGTVILPTGNERRGRGAGGVGFQANLPVSLTPVPQIALHGNAGLTWTPTARDAREEESETLNANAGASIVWLVRPSFNLLVEALWYSTEVVVAPGAEARQESWFINPGVRWAFNFPSGLQIVPGVAYTIGVGDSNGDDGLFLYLSFEHPFSH